jgi:hypothetical protein
MVMTALAVFALERADRGRWSAALPLLTISALAKYTSLILAPLILVAALVADGRRALRPLVTGAVISLILAAAIPLGRLARPSHWLQRGLQGREHP